jgi:RHS repeat-associated protein
VEVAVPEGEKNSSGETRASGARPIATSVTHPQQGVLAGFEVGYDRGGDKLYERHAHEGGKGELYQYDSLSRLAAQAVGVPEPQSHVGEAVPAQFDRRAIYAIDPVHNWTGRVEFRVPADPAQNETRTYDVNALNQYASVATSINGAVPTAESFIYDAVGNLISDGTYDYTYDDRDLVTEVRASSDGSLVAQYVYDAMKRRVAELRADGTVVTHVYDGWQEVQEITDGILTASFVYDDGIDRPIAMVRDGNVSYYHPDPRNNVAMITDADGDVVERYSYDAYGTATITDGVGTVLTDSAVDNPYRFASRRHDEATGMYDFRNRMYSPATGRFLQRDPTWYSDSSNIYSYTVNNPINKYDPFGERADTDTYYGDQQLWEVSAPGPSTTFADRVLIGAIVAGPVIGLQLARGWPSHCPILRKPCTSRRDS